jgi:SCF-associated factor 1
MGEQFILMGDRDMTTDSDALLKPPLQGQSLGSVLLGRSHHGILTTDGKFLTWGRYDSGALGLGDPRDLLPGVPGGYPDETIREMAKNGELIEPPEAPHPSPVRFDWVGGERRKFVLNATVGESHSAALVVDLEDDEECAESASIGWLTSARQKVPRFLTPM